MNDNELEKARIDKMCKDIDNAGTQEDFDKLKSDAKAFRKRMENKYKKIIDDLIPKI